MSLLRFVVVGAGSIGREFALRHLVASNGAEVVGIVDINIEAARQLAIDVSLARAGGQVGGQKYRETVDITTLVSDLACVITVGCD